MLRNFVRLTAGVSLAALAVLTTPSTALGQTYLGPDLQPYAVMGGTTVTCTGASVVTGDVGVSPGTAITGFPAPCTNVGTLRVPPASDPGKANLVTAYGTLDALGCSSTIGPDLTGLILPPGVYCVTAAASNLTGTLTLNAGGDPAATWTFQMASTLITSPNSTVAVVGASACNVQWLVRSSATLDTNTTFVGNILALTAIAMNDGASLAGRALARNAAVTLSNNNVSIVPCTGAVPTLPQVAMLLLAAGLLGLGYLGLRGRARAA
ncbi:MAG TPA: ice-binding family protein [Vicinamibacterales bacterium]|nr:ice-binding family protein [Vicinamibacterales bacterium]